MGSRVGLDRSGEGPVIALIIPIFIFCSTFSSYAVVCIAFRAHSQLDQSPSTEICTSIEQYVVSVVPDLSLAGVRKVALRRKSQ